MRKFICYVAIFVHLSAVATEKKVEVVYLTQGYKNMVNVLSQGLTIDQIGAHLTMQTMDIRLFQDLHDFAIERKIDPTTAKIKIRAEKGKIFIEGLKHPIQVANSPELKLSYLDQEIPYASGRSLGENLKIIETFFQRQSKTSMRWNGLLFGEQVAQAQIDAGMRMALIAVAAIGVAYAGLSKAWNSLFEPNHPTDLFSNAQSAEDLEIGCDSSNNSIFFMKRGPEKFKFKLSENTTPTGINGPSSLIEITHSKMVGEADTVYRFDRNKNEENSQTTDRVRSILSSMVPKMVPKRGEKFLCPADQKTLDSWKTVAKTITNSRRTVKDLIPGELDKPQPATAK